MHCFCYFLLAVIVPDVMSFRITQTNGSRAPPALIINVHQTQSLRQRTEQCATYINIYVCMHVCMCVCVYACRTVSVRLHSAVSVCVQESLRALLLQVGFSKVQVDLSDQALWGVANVRKDQLVLSFTAIK